MILMLLLFIIVGVILWGVWYVSKKGREDAERRMKDDKRKRLQEEFSEKTKKSS